MDAAELRRERLDDAGGQALVFTLLMHEETKNRNATFLRLYHFLGDPGIT